MNVYYAQPGELHRAGPFDVFDGDTRDWHCPDCDRVLAATAYRDGRVVGSAARGYTAQPIAERQGVALYGPSTRAREGKGPRRSESRLLSGSDERLLLPPDARRAGDVLRGLYPIEALTFDTPCLDCSIRVRVQLPSE